MIRSLYSQSSTLVEVPEDLATSVLLLGIAVVQDAVGGGEDEVAELAGREEVLGPLVDGVDGEVEAGRDDTALVDATVQVDDDLAGALVIDDLELLDVA